MEGNGTLTILEASKIIGKSVKTVHRYVKKGLLHVKTGYNHGKEVMTVERGELLRVFKMDVGTGYDTSRPNDKTGYDNDKTCQDNIITRQNLKETFKEFLEEQKTELMKPLEQHALVRYGAVSKENEFLKAKVETLLQEIEQYKALPWQIQERDEEIKAMAEKLKGEKTELEVKLIQDKEKALTEIQYLHRQEIDLIKSEAEKKIEETEALLKQETQKKQKEIQEQAEAEKVELETRLKTESDEREKQISDAWKKKVEELSRPWWKKIFS